MEKNRDMLTGLPGRPMLSARLTRAIEEDEGAAIGLLDVDRFMEINTSYGQEKGDRVLETIAALLTEEPESEAFRVSGDEFALVMPRTSLEQAFLRMERLRAKICEEQDRFGLPKGHEITITAGVAQAPRDARDESSLLRTADAALLAAKEGGRNQVSLPPNEEMIMKTCYYPSGMARRLRTTAERLNRKESVLLREALDDLLRKYDRR